MATGEELAIFYTRYGDAHGGDYTWSQVAEKFGEDSALAARSKARRAGYTADGFDINPDDIEDGIKFEVEGNYAQARAKGGRIKSLEDLLWAAEVDPEVWKVDRHEINKWEVGAKCKEVDLEFNAGISDGYVKSDGRLTIEPLFQVKAWLSRINPEPVYPTIQPIETNLKYEKPPEPSDKDVYRTVIWADPQIGYRKDIGNAKLEPFHDRRALDVAVQIIADAKPDRIDGLGDSGDFTMWTDRFLRDPEFYHTTQPMLCELHWWLAEMRMTAPYAQMKLHQGNHEVRLENQIKKHLVEAHELRSVDEMELPPAMSMPKLLALHKLGIEWVDGYPDDEDWLNDVVCLSHGDTARVPGQTAKKISREVDYVSIVGHIHRQEMVVRSVHTRNGNKIALSYCVPCLCRIDGVVPGSDKRAHWSQGITIVDYAPDGYYGVNTIPIMNGEAIWNGKRFKGRDRLDEIQDTWPEFNW